MPQYLKKSATCYDYYSVVSKRVGDFFQISVAFSENCNFLLSYFIWNHKFTGNSQSKLETCENHGF